MVSFSEGLSRKRKVQLASGLLAGSVLVGVLVWQLHPTSSSPSPFPDPDNSSIPSTSPNTNPPPLLHSPYIRLMDQADEPFGHGWGIDLPGFGPSLRFNKVQAHTLKPADVGNSDMHQTWDLETGQIRFSEDGSGRCLEAETATYLAFLNANPCSPGSSLQKWIFGEDATFRLVDNDSLCLAVGGRETERAAGPWVRRDLVVGNCSLSQNMQNMVWIIK